MGHGANVGSAVDLPFHTAFASARAFVWHWTSIRTAVNATAITLLLAHIAVACWILVQNRTNIRAGESIFLRELVVGIARRVLVRHWTNIRTGEDLLLATALLLARVIIIALRRIDVGT